MIGKIYPTHIYTQCVFLFSYKGIYKIKSVSSRHFFLDSYKLAFISVTIKSKMSICGMTLNIYYESETMNY